MVDSDDRLPRTGIDKGTQRVPEAFQESDAQSESRE